MNSRWIPPMLVIMFLIVLGLINQLVLGGRMGTVWMLSIWVLGYLSWAAGYQPWEKR